jgi:D-mannonate dehydratase
MPSLKWVDYGSKKILYTDIASQNTEELLDISKRLRREIGTQPLDSVRLLCCVKDGKINKEINEEIKQLLSYIEPYVKMIAVIGLGGLQTILFNSVLMFTRTKKLTSKNSEEEALNFLSGL